MQKADYQTRILKLEKALENLLQVTDDLELDPDQETIVNEAYEVRYDEALDEESDI